MSSLQVGKTGDEDLSGLPAICRQLVCTECKCWAFMDRNKSRQVQRKQKIVCTNCEKGKGMRPRVMLYDDNEGDAITPDDVWDIMKVGERPEADTLCECLEATADLAPLLQDDVVAADMIVWVGISFEQSASTAYFRRVRQMLMEENRQGGGPITAFAPP